MPHSSVVTYTDLQKMEAAHIAANVEMLPMTREPMFARAVRVELQHLWATHAYESAPRLKHVSLNPSRTFITFLAEPGPDVIIGGATRPVGGLMRHSRGESYFERTTGPVHWGTVSFPAGALSETADAMAHTDLEPPAGSTQVAVPSDGRFHQLHAAIMALAADAPEAIANPGAAHSMEQQLVGALVECLGENGGSRETWAQQCHSTVMRRFHRELADNPDRALYVPEICAAIRVPERTLRLCCQEQLGMSPKHYLTIRRMQLAYRLLLASSRGEVSVTEVAMRFGFWHFGRFATEYRDLFGESPSATLHRS